MRSIGSKKPGGSYQQQEAGGYTVTDEHGTHWVDSPCMCQRLSNMSERKKLLFIFLLVSVLSFSLGFGLANQETRKSIAGSYECNVTPCNFTLDVIEDLKAPVRFNYKLVNFWQSHRVYLNSKSDDQLKGSVTTTSGCSPTSKMDGLPIYPCGLLPQSIFTDRFTVDVLRDDTVIELCPSCPKNDSEDDFYSNYWDSFHDDGNWTQIGTWGGLADTKFVTPNVVDNSSITRNSVFLNGTNLELPYPGNSDMIVWLHPATKETFMKPHREINFDLLAGDTLLVTAFDYYDAGEKGEKYVVFESTPRLGPSSPAHSGCCFAIGFFSLCITFLIIGESSNGRECLGRETSGKSK